MASLQQRQPPIAFRDASLHIDGCVKISRFLPQRPCRLGVGGIALQNCQAANRIRQIEWRSFRVTPIDTQGFVITGPSQIWTSGFAMNVSHVSHCVRQPQRIALNAVQSNRFLVTMEGSFAAMPIPLDLSQSGERASQFGTGTIRATDTDRLD